ncbi:hypothetical protein [Bifidobacterium sp. ESL0764]|uniref:hypothetical protein n=1 Tax=Bifidobacterium sp. ESL0764 TaxID=2983228 RepID=UPI0023FA36A1|nr:hypothetical protein [Bifidobacterium sp. ESL0764]WEV65909.1 hypothetical protein OZX71_00640 [Bifidobacterium sp. ESL0764]
MIPHQTQQKTPLRAAASLLLALLTMLFATACGTTPKNNTTPAPKPQPKTEKITYPAQSMRSFGYSNDARGSRKAAKDLKDSGDFTDAYATKNGDVIIITTEKQRQTNIKKNNEWIANGERTFRKSNPDYHYQINQDGTQMTIWVDNNLTPVAGSSILTVVPPGYGYNYYLKGHTGPWDMTITVRNCHTDQLIHQYQLSQGWKFDAATFGG